MTLYLCIIIVATFLLVLFNALFAGLGVSVWAIIMWSVLGVVLSIILDGIVVLAVRLSGERINIDGAIFKERKGERRLLERLGIRKWKDLIPEMGKKLKYFDKTTVAREVNSEYFRKFIHETCLAELMHIFSLIVAPLLLVILPLKYLLNISLPIVLVNIFLNILPILVQRYTRPKLRIAYLRQLKKEQNTRGENTDETI